MNITFPVQVATYLVFVDWERLLARWRPANPSS